jgi:hypothetical protein
MLKYVDLHNQKSNMKLITLFITTTLSFYCSAQIKKDYQLKQSSVFTDEYRHSTIVHSKNEGKDGCVIARSYKGSAPSTTQGYYIEHYNANMELVKNFEYEQENPPHHKYKMAMGVVSLENTMSFIDIFYNVKEKAYQCMAHNIDLKTNKITDIELFKVSRKELDDMGKITLSGLFYKGENSIDDGSPVAFITSEEKDAFAIMLTIRGKDKKYFKIYSFDNMLTKKLEYTCIRGNKNEDFHFNNINVANAGNTVYLLNMVHTADMKGKESLCELTEVSSGGERTGRFNNEGNLSESLKMFRKGNSIICAGFYIRPDSNWFDGVSYFEMDASTLEVKTIKHTPFSDDIRKYKKGNWIIRKYGKQLNFKGVIITDDGEIILNAEEYCEVTTTPMGGAGMVMGMGITGGNTFYYFDDIITVKINNLGEVDWVKNIGKNQIAEGPDDAYVSYTSIYKNNTLSLFLNIDRDVKTDGKGEVEFKQRIKSKSDLTVIKIDNYGNMSYEKLLDNENSYVPFMTAKGIVGLNDLFFLGRKGRDKQLLKITIQ